ncbi:hypothetical protein Plano_1440 [Planococcus sp. PAMC 21323]|uniref:hypothetical protein n=1 Tax=Planococcus sp. PAMC 21323 TaxID=1526927 RepID=UPI00056EA829|nr:hypothetical protein [Planococcus sp. PAMC 21323]AIY05405.1 hypothetical protein Plano_1440 [Planococcus sp. PAMC 21323]
MKKVALLTILLLYLGGCSNGGIYEFSGTSENWDVFYVVDVTNDDEQKVTGFLEYIGDEPIPETVDYEVRTLLTRMGNTGTTLTDGKAEIGNGCGGCTTFQEDDELEAEIMWDNQQEELILTTKK